MVPSIDRCPLVPDSDNGSLGTLGELGDYLSHPNLFLGVDWLAFSFDVGRILNEDPDLWTMVSQNGPFMRKRQTLIPMGAGDVFLQITEKGNNSTGYASVNPSSVLFERKTFELATLNDALDVFHTVMDEIAQIVEIRTPRMETRLSRVDVAVTTEKDVGNVQRLLEIAAQNPYRQGLDTGIHTSPQGQQTVHCKGKKNQGFRVYNKSAQVGQRGSRVRFGAQTNRKYLKKHCPTVADLDESGCRKIFDFYLGRTVSALCTVPTSTVDMILAQEKHWKTFVEAVGASTLHDHGYTAPLSTHWWSRKYKAFKKLFPHNVIGDFFA